MAHLKSFFAHHQTANRILEPAQRKKGSYRPELDVLRFFAFFAVFLHHALPRDASLYVGSGIPEFATQLLLTAKGAGAYGLDLFFTLSSFLITDLLMREWVESGRIGLRNFYIRRALRIWPLYFVFLLITVLIVPHILPEDQFGTIYLVSFALFSGNWGCVVSGIPFSVASPLWSISVEEQFYIVWPLLLMVFGFNRVRQVAFVLFGIALLARYALALHGATDAAVWCNTLVRLDTIAYGAILAVTLRGRVPQIASIVRLVMCGIAVLLWLLIARYLSQDGFSSLVTYPLSAIASVTLLVATLRKDAGVLNYAPFSWLVYLGKISYGLYVFHLLALTMMSKVLSIPVVDIPLNFERRFILAFILTVISAALSYRFLERPFLKLKRRFSQVPSVSKPKEQAEILDARLIVSNDA
jgi:peptidoglycan/LPS O-acetylase OafA/YrhL